MILKSVDRIFMRGVLVTSCLITISGVAFAQSANPVKVNMLKGAAAVCKELHQVLQLPENELYVQSRNGNDNLLFSIPKQGTKFSVPVWTPATAGEFKTGLPEEYRKLIDYQTQSETKAVDFSGIEKGSIDVFNHGMANDVFRIQAAGKLRNYIVESDPVRKSFKNTFNAVTMNANPFNYDGSVFFATKTGGRLKIVEFKAGGENGASVHETCVYNFKSLVTR